MMNIISTTVLTATVTGSKIAWTIRVTASMNVWTGSQTEPPPPVMIASQIAWTEKATRSTDALIKKATGLTAASTTKATEPIDAWTTKATEPIDAWTTGVIAPTEESTTVATVHNAVTINAKRAGIDAAECDHWQLIRWAVAEYVPPGTTG